MTPKRVHSMVWALVRRQHGVVARRQLLEAGLSAEAIRHRLAKGRLHPVFRGGYAVGRPDLTREGHWMAAVLLCGEGAVLSHLDAAALWEIVRHRGGPIHISVPARRRGWHSGIVVHRRQTLAA